MNIILQIACPPWLNLSFSLALTICESQAFFSVSSKCVSFIKLFVCDDVLHKLESLHAS